MISLFTAYALVVVASVIALVVTHHRDARPRAAAAVIPTWTPPPPPRPEDRRLGVAYIICRGELLCSRCHRGLGVTFDAAVSRTYLACYRCNTVAIDRTGAA